MGIRKIVAIVSLGLIAINVHAGSTNSWKAAGSTFWDTDNAWSLNAEPSLTDTADFITNAASKIVTIDSVVVSDSILTISNLTVGGVGSSTNTLLLNEGGTNVPLEILSSMLVSNGGLLQITNSFLQVDGNVGGMFTLLGSMRVLNKAKVQVNKAVISNGAVMQFALGTGSIPVAVTTDLTLGGTLNIVDGGGFTNTTYTLFTYGGGLINNGPVIGTTPTNSTCVLDTSIPGQVNVIVTLPQPPSSGAFRIVSVARSANDIVITWTAANAGANEIQAENGNCNTNNFADISASIAVNAGVTNTYTDVGGVTNAPSRFYRVRATQ
jgi:hypothetical protein